MSSPLDRLKSGSVPTAQPAAPATPTIQGMSPLDRAAANKASIPAAVPPATAVTTLPAGSPLAKMAKTSNAPAELRSMFALAVTADQLEALSASTSKQVGATTDRITQKFTTANFGELGDMLYKVQSQANSLSADDLLKTGVVGWIRRKTSDVKAVLTKRFQTASKAFDELEGKMIDQRTILETWEADMETLYDENYQNYLALRDLLVRAENAFALNKQALQSFPLIDANDPDAFMKAQLLQEAQAEQNDISVTCDTYRRQITMCENNGPDLRSRIRQSESQRKAITRVVVEVIPLVKREFAKFLQTLEMQKSITLVDGAREMGDKALRLSADSAKDASIATAKSVNAPVISSATIDHIRTRAIEALTAVQQIEQQAEQDREAFAIKNKEDQANYLKQLQQHKAI